MKYSKKEKKRKVTHERLSSCDSTIVRVAQEKKRQKIIGMGFFLSIP